MSEEIKKSETALREEAILSYWKAHTVFEKSLTKDAPKGDFVFYDGPPFATGLPHMGHLLASSYKDAIGRYKTMQGYRVPRRWGWDCHGLPIESLVEKKLGLKSKKDIEVLGVEKFNAEARASVQQFVTDWEWYVDRIGRWVDFKNSYKTMDNSYMESVWWAMKQLHEKELLYQGNRVLMYCTHCETPLAKAEIQMDNTYKDVTEEAVTIKFKVKNPAKHGLPENTFILAWTTTPWTLPGNVGLAVGDEISYSGVVSEGVTYIVATDLQLKVIPGTVVFSKLGSELVGVEYEPLYSIPDVEAHTGAKHVVLSADFVTTTDGTGIVHTAVMYGEDDYNLGKKAGLPMVQLLTANGHYIEKAPEFIRGKFLKAAEKDIKKDLEERGL
ncbi:MAG: class I tRNA ligase family protein, partial [Minisyncoccia bacterium]